jgi:hypothetical protein
VIITELNSGGGSAFVQGTVYYVVNPHTNDFQLATTPSGSAITGGTAIATGVVALVNTTVTLQVTHDYLAALSPSGGLTVNLPDVTKYPVGHTLTIADEGGTAGSNTITIQRSSSNTGTTGQFTDGTTSKTITANGGTFKCRATGQQGGVVYWQVL